MGVDMESKRGVVILTVNKPAPSASPFQGHEVRLSLQADPSLPVWSVDGSPTSLTVNMEVDRDGTGARMTVHDPTRDYSLDIAVSPDGVERLEVVRRKDRAALKPGDLPSLSQRWIKEMAFCALGVLRTVRERVAAGEAAVVAVTENGLQLGRHHEDAGQMIAAFLDHQRESLRALKTQSRSALRREVAARWLQAVEEGHPSPKSLVASEVGYSESYVGRLLSEARMPEIGELPPVRRGRPRKEPST